MKIGFNAPAPAAAYSVRTVQSERRIMQFMFFSLSLFSEAAETGDSIG